MCSAFRLPFLSTRIFKVNNKSSSPESWQNAVVNCRVNDTIFWKDLSETDWVLASASDWESGLPQEESDEEQSSAPDGVSCDELGRSGFSHWKWAFAVSSTKLTPETHIVHLIEAFNSLYLLKNRTIELWRWAGNDTWLASSPECDFSLSLKGRCQFSLRLWESVGSFVGRLRERLLNHSLQMPEGQRGSHAG